MLFLKAPFFPRSHPCLTYLLPSHTLLIVGHPLRLSGAVAANGAAGSLGFPAVSTIASISAGFAALNNGLPT